MWTMIARIVVMVSLLGGFGFVILVVAATIDSIRDKIKNKKGKKMEKIYWNEKEGQIMTKGGKCLYDRKDFERRMSETNDYNRQVAINNCGIEGHSMEFCGDNLSHSIMGSWVIQQKQYQFRCKCGLETIKIAGDLTTKEKDGLGKLGLL